MSDFDSRVADISKLAQQLAAMKKTLAETEEYLEIVAKEEMREIQKLEEEKGRIDETIAIMRTQIREKHPETAEAAEDLTNKKSRLEKDIKALCQKLDTERLAKRGVKIADNDDAPSVQITVSKVQTVTAFDTDAVLRDFPGLADAATEDGPAVVQTVRPEIVSQLISEGKVPKGVMKHATIHKKKAPSVRINYSE